ncbi:MAG: type II toxin-antitoxin system RelE/ParE family toxin [Gammaproteobacteria bacterium]|nr:type II toxin-antitoxin system RelE/ParE family toxin [Gammaproteobacteria bacterium]
MRAFKTKWFQHWAVKEGLSDQALQSALNEINSGLVDANLGGHIIKKRVALPGQGKRGSLRTLLAFRLDSRAFFIYGFAKNERANIDQKELKVLKLLAKELLSYNIEKLKMAVMAGELIEVTENG